MILLKNSGRWLTLTSSPYSCSGSPAVGDRRREGRRGEACRRGRRSGSQGHDGLHNGGHKRGHKGLLHSPHLASGRVRRPGPAAVRPLVPPRCRVHLLRRSAQRRHACQPRSTRRIPGLRAAHDGRLDPYDHCYLLCTPHLVPNACATALTRSVFCALSHLSSRAALLLLSSRLGLRHVRRTRAAFPSGSCEDCNPQGTRIHVSVRKAQSDKCKEDGITFTGAETPIRDYDCWVSHGHPVIIIHKSDVETRWKSDLHRATAVQCC